MILEPSWYARDPRVVAEELIGKRLVRISNGERLAGIIVETEAYLARGDSAAHSARGETRSNRSMFRQAGIAYVYPIHAKHCFNVVTEQEGLGSAVLVRAMQPECGVSTMLVRRNVVAARNIANGPAKLCQALAIDRTQDGLVLNEENAIWFERVESASHVKRQIKQTHRIGVTSAESLRLRFVLAGSVYASGPKRLR